MHDLDQLASSVNSRYDIVRELGRGGMATVYLARDRKHELIDVFAIQGEIASAIATQFNVTLTGVRT